MDAEKLKRMNNLFWEIEKRKEIISCCYKIKIFGDDEEKNRRDLSEGICDSTLEQIHSLLINEHEEILHSLEKEFDEL